MSVWAGRSGSTRSHFWGHVLLVAHTSSRMWLRQTSERLHVPVRRVAAMVALGALMLLALGVGAGYFTVGSSSVDLTTRASETTVIFAVSTLAGSLATVGLSTLMPRSDALSLTLELLPISRTRAMIGSRITLVIGATYVALAMSGAALVLFWQAPRPLVAAAGLLTVVALVVASVLLTVGTLALVEWCLTSALRLPGAYGVVGSAAVVSGTAVVLMAADAPFLGLLELPVLPTPGRAAAELLTGLADGSVPIGPGCILLGWAGLCLATLLGAARLRAGDISEGYSRLLRGLGTPRRRTSALIWSEFLQLVRSPHVAVLTLLVALAGLLVVLLQDRSPAVGAMLAGSLLAAPFFFGMQSFGRTWPHHWIGTVVAADSPFWVWPKAVASLFLGVLVSGVLGAVFVLVDVVDGHTLTALAPAAGLGWAVTMVSGTLVPYTASDTASSTLTGFAVVVGYSVASALTVVATRWIGFGEVPTQLALVLLLLALYLKVARARGISPGG